MTATLFCSDLMYKKRNLAISFTTISALQKYIVVCSVIKM